MYCPRCGTLMQGGICPECGAKMTKVKYDPVYVDEDEMLDILLEDD